MKRSDLNITTPPNGFFFKDGPASGTGEATVVDFVGVEKRVAVITVVAGHFTPPQLTFVAGRDQTGFHQSC